jgi:cytochrome c peroxidase
MTLVHHTIQTATAAIALFDHTIQIYDSRYDKVVYVL